MAESRSRSQSLSFVQPDIPIGAIALWSTTFGSVPYNWMIANGERGSPDLRNEFIPGAGDTYAPGSSGGSVNHTHTFTGDGHLHLLPGGTDIQSGPWFGQWSRDGTATGTTDPANSLPPYKSLFWIFHKGRRNYHVA